MEDIDVVNISREWKDNDIMLRYIPTRPVYFLDISKGIKTNSSNILKLFNIKFHKTKIIFEHKSIVEIQTFINEVFHFIPYVVNFSTDLTESNFKNKSQKTQSFGFGFKHCKILYLLKVKTLKSFFKKKPTFQFIFQAIAILDDLYIDSADYASICMERTFGIEVKI